MTTSPDRVDFSLKWCIPVGTVLILYLVWQRSKTKPGKTIKSVSIIPILYNIFIKAILRRAKQIKVFKTTNNILPVCIGLAHLYKKDKLIQLVWAGQRIILCFDADISEKIFLSNFALNKDWIYKLLEPWLGLGLFTSGDERWRKRRKMLTPAFHFRILKDFLEVFNEQSKVVVENLNKSEGEEVDITSIIPLCTLDIIGETAMGVHLNAQSKEGGEYVKATKFLTCSVVSSFAKPWYWIKPLYWLTSHYKEQKKNISIVHNFTNDVIRKRKEKMLKDKEVKELFDDFQDYDDVGTKKRRAFLDLLLYHHLADNSLSEADIREEVDAFTFGGHDTTATTISWALYLLGLDKDIQEKAYQEIWQICGDDKERKLTTEDLNEMKYLECIIKETLRIFPVAPIILRRTKKDIEADGYIIPANSSVAVVIYALHHDSVHFPNPDIFDPDRFLPENSLRRHPFVFVPFSAGSRNCIAQRFAMIEVKTILAYIIRNFIITSLDHRDKITFAGDIILRPKKPLYSIFEKR